MIQKTIAFLLAALMLLGCAASAELAGAEEHVIQSGEGDFILTFRLPQGAEFISGEWLDSLQYIGNIRSSDGLYLYLSVAGPEEGIADGDTSPVTWNASNGITEEYLKQMADDLFSDDFGDFEKGVAVTAYGTMLSVVRCNDPGSPFAYIFTVWNDYEIGLSLFCRDSAGNQRPISDAQISRIVDFVSELWIYSNAEASSDGEDEASGLARFVDVYMPESIQSVSVNEKLLTSFLPSEGAASCSLTPVKGTAGLESAAVITAGDLAVGLKIQTLFGDIPCVTDLELAPPAAFSGAADQMTKEEIAAQHAGASRKISSVRLVPGSGWNVSFSDEYLKVVREKGSEALLLSAVPGHAGESGQVTLNSETLTMEIYAVILSDGTPAVYSIILE